MVKIFDYFSEKKATEKSKIIILTGFKNPLEILKISKNGKNFAIWEYNWDIIKKELEKKEINSNNYYPYGTLARFTGINPPQAFILGKKEENNITNEYEYIGKIDNLNIWEPVFKNKNITNLGYYITKCKKKPQSKVIGINSKKVKNEENKKVGLGEYYLINFDNIKKIIKINVENENEDINNEDENMKEGNITLVDTKKPWYKKNENNNKNEYDPFANFSGRIRYAKHPNNYRIIDKKHPNLGYGYSYASRLFMPQKEGFNNETKDSMIMNPLYVIIILIIILLLV